MRRSRKLQRTKVTYPVFAPTPRLLILAIRQALQTPLRPLAPKPPLKEAKPAELADAKGLRLVANTPTEALEEDREPESTEEAPSDCPEHAMWVAVLKQAILDAKSKDLALRADALEFFESADFLKVLDYAGIDRDLAPSIRSKVRSLKPRTARPHALAA